MSEIIEEPVHVLFQFKQCKGLRGSGKGPSVVMVMRVEFNASLLGESHKVEVDTESESTPLDFSCQMNVPVDDPAIFDEIAQKPVVVTFIEILPKVHNYKCCALEGKYYVLSPSVLLSEVQAMTVERSKSS